MNPQGRMLADVFIHRQCALEDGSPRWLLDIDSRTLPSLLAFIKKFKLRSKVKLTDVSSNTTLFKLSILLLRMYQARSLKSSAWTSLSNHGYRGILPADNALEFGSEATQVDSDEYTLHRIINGVGEGALDFPLAPAPPRKQSRLHKRR